MKPLAEQFRPSVFEEVAGQEHLIGKHGFITSLIGKKQLLSLIFWGPPGSGKTTLARLYAESFGVKFISLSAVTSSLLSIKTIIQEIEKEPLFYRKVVIFVDEIHRFNKAQQDFFLPFVEKGVFTLIGATTENPSFALNNALLSRMRVLEVKPLNYEDLKNILLRYEKQRGILPLDEEAKAFLLKTAGGDGRYLFNLIENLPKSEALLSSEEIAPYLQKRAALYDREGEGHYNLISALHKAVRGSDPEAALYWFCRMLEGGEDPYYIARRLIRMAVEDIGLADPEALKQALAARECFHILGSPEGELALASVVVYLALAPKSISVYKAYGKMREIARQTNHLAPPKSILNAPTKLMKELGYSKDYAYDPETPHGFSGAEYFPEKMKRTNLYEPSQKGFEKELKKRLDFFNELRERIRKKVLD